MKPEYRISNKTLFDMLVPFDRFCLVACVGPNLSFLTNYILQHEYSYSYSYSYKGKSNNCSIALSLCSSSCCSDASLQYTVTHVISTNVSRIHPIIATTRTEGGKRLVLSLDPRPVRPLTHKNTTCSTKVPYKGIRYLPVVRTALTVNTK